MRARRGTAGFTLIEVVVVVVLVALFMSTTVVRLDGTLPSTRTESAARQLLGTLDFARTYALSYGQPHEVVLDFEEQRYAIRLPWDEDGKLAPDPEDREMLTWQVLSDGVELRALVDASGDLIDRGQEAIEFHPGGSGREVYIHLGNMADEGYDMTVRLLALTGLASVIQGVHFPEELREQDF